MSKQVCFFSNIDSLTIYLDMLICVEEKNTELNVGLIELIKNVQLLISMMKKQNIDNIKSSVGSDMLEIDTSGFNDIIYKIASGHIGEDIKFDCPILLHKDGDTFYRIT